MPGRDDQVAWAHAPRFNGTEGEARGAPLIHDSDETGILGQRGIPTGSDVGPRPLYATVLSSGDDDDRGTEPEPKRRSLSRAADGPRPGPTPEQRAAVRRGMLRRSRQPPRETWDPKVEYRRVGMATGKPNANCACLRCRFTCSPA